MSARGAPESLGLTPMAVTDGKTVGIAVGAGEGAELSRVLLKVASTVDGA